jgi:hypothetical protein
VALIAAALGVTAEVFREAFSGVRPARPRADGGSGYRTPPKATVKGMGGLKLKVTIRFAKELKKNGAVAGVEVE